MRALVMMTLIALGAPEAGAWSPHVGLTLERIEERMSVEVDGRDYGSTRGLLSDGLELGVDYPLPAAWLPAGRLEGRSALGLGLVYHTGRWPLSARQAALWRFTPAADLSLFIGLSLGLASPAADEGGGAWRISTPVGARWGWMELAWRPGLVGPVGGDEQKVLGGRRAREINLGWTWLSLTARVHL